MKEQTLRGEIWKRKGWQCRRAEKWKGEVSREQQTLCGVHCSLQVHQHSQRHSAALGCH